MLLNVFKKTTVHKVKKNGLGLDYCIQLLIALELGNDLKRYDFD